MTEAKGENGEMIESAEIPDSDIFEMNEPIENTDISEINGDNI